MSVSSARNNITRIQNEIARLKGDEAREARKEAELNSRIIRAIESANRASSTTSAQTYLRQVEMHQNELVRCKDKLARLASDLARKTTDLHRGQEQLLRAEKLEQDKTDRERERMMKALEGKNLALTRAIDNQLAGLTASPQLQLTNVSAHDVFISHASEDKDDFVRALAEALRDEGLNIWYDEFSLAWGDSLRRNIDRGLASSRFGIVILSENFFAKEWPQRELDGLVAREVSGDSRIFPIWHKVTKDEVARFSPTLSDRLAINTAMFTVSEIAKKFQAICNDADQAA